MKDVVIIGDGPGGLSAALFLAKNGLSTTVYGQDKTAMHYALLRNYLGLGEITGTDFQKQAREQVLALGAALDDRLVDGVARDGGAFRITLNGGETVEARYLVLSEGKAPKLAQQLGLRFEGPAVVTDKNGQTSVPGVYAVGRLARPGRSQAIISAGDGAVAALDILSKEKGQDVVDWDSPPKK
ncbi:MAG TPA: FAD-dependent oxidoreductase [Polyangiaceae bacterium]|nr:FAD-dependent oxidoreductase [Polyangiaceae bacterium]